MTAMPAQSPVLEGRHSLEVRWILPGPLKPAVTGWFGRFPAEMAAREDMYLLRPDLGGLSVKIRAGTALEVKACLGSPGILNVTGRARGHIESWRKWSFPFSPPSRDDDLAGWAVIRKTRRVARFPLAGGQAMAAAVGSAMEAACAVELTEIRSGHQAWWSLGFEATGPAERLRSTLQSTAMQIFDQALPGDMELGLSDCRSYAQWLSFAPRTEVNQGTYAVKTLGRGEHWWPVALAIVVAVFLHLALPAKYRINPHGWPGRAAGPASPAIKPWAKLCWPTACPDLLEAGSSCCWFAEVRVNCQQGTW